MRDAESVLMEDGADEGEVEDDMSRCKRMMVKLAQQRGEVGCCAEQVDCDAVGGKALHT